MMKNILTALLLSGTATTMNYASARTVQVVDENFELHHQEAIAQYNRAVELLLSMTADMTQDEKINIQKISKGHFVKAKRHAEVCLRIQPNDEKMKEILAGCDEVLNGDSNKVGAKK